MFGSGPRSASLGNRLLVALLIVLLLMLLTQPAWLVFVLHPFQYPLPLLLVTGKILLVDALAELAMFGLMQVAQSVGSRIDNRNKPAVLVEIEYHPDWSGCLLPITSAVLLVASVLLAPQINMPWWAAAYGWLVALAAMIGELGDLPAIPTHQLARIEASEDSEIIYIWLQNEVHGSIGTTIKTDWEGAVGYLNANGWELVETLQVDRKMRGRTCWERTAHLRRLRPTSPLFNDWRRELKRFVFAY